MLTNGATTYPQPSGRPVHDAAIGRRRGFDGVLDQPCEAVADGVCLAAVEAEDELVEVVLQVLGADGAVVGAEAGLCDALEETSLAA